MSPSSTETFGTEVQNDLVSGFLSTDPEPEPAPEPDPEPEPDKTEN